MVDWLLLSESPTIHFVQHLTLPHLRTQTSPPKRKGEGWSGYKLHLPLQIVQGRKVSLVLIFSLPVFTVCVPDLTRPKCIFMSDPKLSDILKHDPHTRTHACMHPHYKNRSPIQSLPLMHLADVLVAVSNSLMDTLYLIPIPLVCVGEPGNKTAD